MLLNISAFSKSTVQVGQEEALAASSRDKAVLVILINASDYPTPAQLLHYFVPDNTSTFPILGGPPPALAGQFA